MAIGVVQVLDLVGRLDDSPGDETPRERFRRYLSQNVTEVGQIRDYVQECLRSKGEQYSRALQDLVNHLGRFLGFETTFGRYKGVPSETGFDGLWKSPKGFWIVVEVKSSEVYAKTAPLVGYIADLVSEKQIPDEDRALGLYVVGRPDPETNQLENAIIAEKRTGRLRIVSVESLLSLAEMANEYDVSHEDVLALLRPSGPQLDPVVDLMARLVAETEVEVVNPPPPGPEEKAAHWLTPVRNEEEETAADTIQTLVGQERVYAFGERTPGRKHIKPGDWICFYENGKGVVAHGRIASAPAKKPHPKVRRSDIYPWTFALKQEALYLDEPVVIDSVLRSKLDAFKGRDTAKPWAWFVQATRRVSQQDFETLTRPGAKS